MAFEDEAQPAPPRAAPSEAQRVREDLRRLGALEVTHVVLGVTVLAVISVRAVFVAEQSIEAMAMALVSVFAFSYLAAAFHFRASQSLLRKDLFGLTLAEERRRERANDACEPAHGVPYRSAPPRRAEADDHLRESATRWRRFALILLVLLTVVLLVSVPMVAHVLMELPHKAGRLH